MRKLFETDFIKHSRNLNSSKTYLSINGLQSIKKVRADIENLVNVEQSKKLLNIVILVLRAPVGGSTLQS